MYAVQSVPYSDYSLNPYHESNNISSLCKQSRPRSGSSCAGYLVPKLSRTLSFLVTSYPNDGYLVPNRWLSRTQYKLIKCRLLFVKLIVILMDMTY